MDPRLRAEDDAVERMADSDDVAGSAIAGTKGPKGVMLGPEPSIHSRRNVSRPGFFRAEAPSFQAVPEGFR